MGEAIEGSRRACLMILELVGYFDWIFGDIIILYSWESCICGSAMML